MPIGILNNEEWSFTSFSASCVECGRSSEPGDVFYSGLTREDQSKEEETEADDESSTDQPQQEERQKEDEEDADDSSGSEDGVSFRRIDYCSGCWNQVTPDFFSYWRTEVPESEEEDQEPDRSTLAGLWKGLLQQPEEEASDPSDEPVDPESDLEHGLVYLLTLMLMRKGFLALEHEVRKNGQTLLEVRVKGTEDDIYQITEPELNEEQINAVKEELADLLDMEEEEER